MDRQRTGRIPLHASGWPELERPAHGQGISAVKHQHEVGSDLGDTFKEMVSGERALKAGGGANTMLQFAA